MKRVRLDSGSEYLGGGEKPIEKILGELKILVGQRTSHVSHEKIPCLVSREGEREK